MAQITFNFTTDVANRIATAFINNHGGPGEGATPAEKWAYVKTQLKEYMRNEVLTYERSVAVAAANAGVNVDDVDEG